MSLARIPESYRAGRSPGKRVAKRLLDRRRADSGDDDLGVVVRLCNLNRGLDGVAIPLVGYTSGRELAGPDPECGKYVYTREWWGEAVNVTAGSLSPLSP